MPFGNEADDFMKSFTGVMSLYSKFPTKDERRLQKAQADLAEQEASPEAGALRTRATEAGISETTARTGVLTEQERRGAYENDPAFRAREAAGTDAETRLKTSQAAQNEFLTSPEMQNLTKLKLKADTGLSEAQTSELNEKIDAMKYANTPEQRKIAQDQFIATTAKLNADALQARSVAAGVDADTAKKNADNAEQMMVTTYQTLLEFAGSNPEFPLDALGLPKAITDAVKGAVAVDPFDSAVPGPQSSKGAIPSTQDLAAQDATIQQASYTPDDLTNQHDDNEGHDGGPSGSAPPEAIPAAQPQGEGNVIQAQGGIRKQPISAKLNDTLSQAAADTGLTVRVTSGGQPSSGANRTGSHRHDDGNAADLQLIDENGHVLSMKDPTDRARMMDFISASHKHGATGVGAAENYMGDKTIHVGFGTEAVWGAGGHGKNAPSWLREAYGAEGGGAASSPAGQAAAAEAGGASQEDRAGPTARRRGRAPPKLVNDGRAAAIEGWKGVMKAGLRIGAVGTQQDQQGAKAVLTGQGAIDPELDKIIDVNYKKGLAKGYQQTQAELNLGKLALGYNYYMNKGEPDKARTFAGKMLQSYRQKYSQYLAMTKQIAQNGDMDKAAQMAAKTYAWVPNGYEAKLTKAEGGYNLTVTDMKDPNRVLTEQLLSPDEMYSQVMKMSPIDFDRQLARAAGEYVPSREMEQLQGNIQAGTAPMAPQNPTTDTGRATGQAHPAIPIPNYAAMDPKEAEQGRLQYAQGQEQVTAANKATEQPAPYSVSDRQSVESEVATVFQAMAEDPNLAPVGQALKDAFGGRLAGIASDVRRLNPSMPTQDILTNLGTMVTPASETQLNFALLPRRDQTKQNTVQVAVRGGNNLSMSPDTFNAVQAAAQRNMKGMQNTYYQGQQDQQRVAQRNTARAQQMSEAERMQMPQAIAAMRDKIRFAENTGQGNIPAMKQQLQRLEQQLQATQQVNGAIPVTHH